MVKVAWESVGDKRDPRWMWSRVLYAYVAGPRQEIVYIGKAGRCSIRQRWSRAAKAGFWDDLERERGIYRHGVLVGDMILDEGRRYSEWLLGDVESLLTLALKPWGNIMNRDSREPRVGLEVTCFGAWPWAHRRFLDQGERVLMWAAAPRTNRA